MFLKKPFLIRSAADLALMAVFLLYLEPLVAYMDMEQEKAGINWQKTIYVSWEGTVEVHLDWDIRIKSLTVLQWAD